MTNLRTITRVATVSFLTFALFSCSWSSKPPARPDVVPEKPRLIEEQKTIGEVEESINNVAEDIGESANSIDEHAEDIRSATPVEQLPAIRPSLEGIGNETDELRAAESDLIVSQHRLADVKRQLSDEQSKVEEWTNYASNAEAQNKDLREQIDKLNEESSRQFRKMMTWIGVVSVAGIGVCIALAIWLRSATAFMIAIGFGATLAVSIAVTLYIKTIALVTIIVFGAAFAGVLIYFAWHFYQAKKTEEELVHTGEITKQYLPEEAREKLFGYGAEPGTINQIQSKTTQRRVKQIRQYNDNRRPDNNAPRLPQTYRSTSVVHRSRASVPTSNDEFIIAENDGLVV